MSAESESSPMPSPDPKPPLGGLSPADLLRQGAAEDTLADGGRFAFDPPSPEELALAFPQFEILDLIGQGGMGAVYRVRQRELDRVVALKILPPALGEGPSFSDRFAREAKALAKLSHPGIVTVHEFGRCGGFYFILMEHVDGVNLRQLMQQERISPREALAIVPQVCDALQFAHDHGIVHRDIKPENLLIDRRGRVKVADFGLAKLATADPEQSEGNTTTSALHTAAGKVMGTPSYMAPEQIDKPSEVDHRADIYALGVVLYQMLTGELPDERLEAPSRKVKIDVRLDEIVLQALEKDPELRFQQASVFKTRVEEAQESLTKAKRFSCYRRWAMPLQLIALILVLAGFAGMLRVPEGLQLQGRYRATPAASLETEKEVIAIVRQSVVDATLARSEDSREWLISVHHKDPAVAEDEFRRIEDALHDSLGAELIATETSSASASAYSRWFQVIPGLITAGAIAGIAGAALLLGLRRADKGKTLGRIALAALALSILSPALLSNFPRILHGSGWLVLLTASLGFGLAGRHSTEGRLALLGVWFRILIWSAALLGMQFGFPSDVPPGFKVIVARPENGDLRRFIDTLDHGSPLRIESKSLMAYLENPNG